MPTTNDTTTTETTTTTTDTTTDTGTETTTVSTTTGTTTTAEVTGDTTGTTNSTEVVEVDWEQIQPVFEFRQRLVNLENHFSSMCLQFEKNKTNLMNQIVYGQADLYAMAQNLQKELNVNENLTYELKLPATPGEKGYFLRKDNQSCL